MGGWNLSIPMRVAVPCLLLGLVFFLVAFGVKFWVTLSIQDTEVNGGLWKVCATHKGVTVCSDWSDKDFKGVQRDWLHKNQALQCLALILLLGTVGALVVFLLTKLKAALVTALLTCFLAAFFTALGCALFASDVSSDHLYSLYGKLGWAFGFAAVAAVLLVAAAVSLILHLVLATRSANTSTSSSSSKPV